MNMKKTIVLFLSAFLIAGCSSNATQTQEKKDTDKQIVQTELEKTPEMIVQNSIEKLKKAESFDMEFVEEDTPMNEFYKYAKTTISGTWTDVQNEVFEGNYGDVKVHNDDPDTKRNEMDLEGPITKKAGEDAILPAEYNDGYEFSLGFIDKFPADVPNTNEEYAEYTSEQEETENGIRYVFHTITTIDRGNGAVYDETIDYVYELDDDENLIYFKSTWISPLFTNSGILTDQIRTVTREFTYENITYIE